MLTGGRDLSDWLKNLGCLPGVTVRIGAQAREGHARVVVDEAEDARARRLVLAKYEPRYAGDLTSWGRTSLPVAVDLR